VCEVAGQKQTLEVQKITFSRFFHLLPYPFLQVNHAKIKSSKSKNSNEQDGYEWNNQESKKVFHFSLPYLSRRYQKLNT